MEVGATMRLPDNNLVILDIDHLTVAAQCVEEARSLNPRWSRWAARPQLEESTMPGHSSESTLESNKEIVLNFIRKAVNEGDIEAASVHFGEQYTQHNPNIADGADGFRAYVQQLRASFPLVRGEVKKIFAEGDFVIVHMHAKRVPAEEGIAIVDIFRLEASRLVEHWEVRQPIERSKLHANSMI
jgi:predicted SnoaL-like aldol condensation-catalyzing enzyme